MKKLQTIFANAYANKQAIPGFNFDSLEIAKAIAAASLELEYPVLLMMTESAAKSMGIDLAIQIAKTLQKNHPYLFIHWDHGFNYDLAIAMVDHQFDSVMFDGSKLSWEDNVHYSRLFTEYAKSYHVWSECEIGQIGGKEDEHESQQNDYTSYQTAIDFFNQTRPNLLAVALGTVHGLNQKAKPIHFANITKISQAITPHFLVLHGCSGVSEADLTKAINCGITKLNFGTTLKKIALDTARTYLNAHLNATDLKPMNQLIEQTVKQEVIKIIQLCQNHSA